MHKRSTTSGSLSICWRVRVQVQTFPPWYLVPNVFKVYLDLISMFGWFAQKKYTKYVQSVIANSTLGSPDTGQATTSKQSERFAVVQLDQLKRNAIKASFSAIRACLVVTWVLIPV